MKTQFDIAPSSAPDTKKGLRKWQQKALKALGKSRHTFITAPCGSGKSTMQVELACREVVDSHFTQKQLMVVPQSHISESFANHTVKIGQKTYIWKVTPETTFCDSAKTVKRLKAWLLSTPASLTKGLDKSGVGRLAAVSSYATLVGAFSGMTKTEKRKAYTNLSLHIDEAHHINGLFDDGDKKGKNSKEQNLLSQVCQDALNGLGHNTTGLHFTTATPMRGDHDIILTEKAKKNFAQFSLTWDEWLPELGIKSINLKYQDYKNVATLQGAILAHLKKDIKAGRRVWIMVPPTGIGWRKKSNTYKSIVDAIAKIPGAHLQDFVPYESDRDAKEHLHPGAKTNVLVTCRWGTEGTDWVPCDTVYNLMVDGSITLAIQKWGRPLRKLAGKEIVNIVNFLAFPKKVTKGRSVRETLSDHTNALMASMVMGENLSGGLLADMQALTHEQQAKVFKIAEEYTEDLLAAKLKGADEAAKLQEQATKRLLSITKPPSDLLRLEGFDRINEYADSLMAGHMTKEHMAQIRKLMAESKKSLTDRVKEAEALHKKQGPTWVQGLKKTNSALYTAVWGNPEAFKHIPQEGTFKSLTDRVKEAEALHKKQGPTWVQGLGKTNSALSQAVWGNPEAFKHIPQKKAA